MLIWQLTICQSSFQLNEGQSSQLRSSTVAQYKRRQDWLERVECTCEKSRLGEAEDLL